MALQQLTLQSLFKYVNAGFRDNGTRQVTLDANGEYVAAIMRVTASGTIDRIHFNVNAVTADGDGLRIRIETVGTSDGFPTGTLVSGSSEVTVTTASAGWNRSPSGLGAAVSAGDIIAVKLLSPSTGTTFNGVINFARYPTMTSSYTGHMPYVVEALPTATKWTSAESLMNLALEYNDGSTPSVWGCTPIYAITQSNFSTGHTYDAYGVVFTLPFRCTVVGYVGMWSATATATSIVELRNASDTVLASRSHNPAIARSEGGNNRFDLFTAPVTLEANTTYRLAVRSDTTNASTMPIAVIDTSVGGTRLYEAAGFTSTNWCLTQRAASGGTWSEQTDRYAPLGLLISHIEDGAGGSGAGFPSSSNINGVIQS